MTSLPVRRTVWPDGGSLDDATSHPVARELLLTEQEGWVKLEYLDAWELEGTLVRPAGLYFMRTDKPGRGGPVAFLAPPPYHPVEVMLANRGFGGVYDGVTDIPIEKIKELSKFRASRLPQALTVVAAVLGCYRVVAAETYHLFTPFNLGATMHTGQLLPVWRELGFTRQHLDAAFASARTCRPATRLERL